MPAGSGSHRRHLDRVVAVLRGRGCTVVVRDAGPVPGAAEMARAHRRAGIRHDRRGGRRRHGRGGCQRHRRAAPRPIAILPLGTANVLAAEIGLPRRAADRAALIATGTARPVWPGRIGGRFFVTQCEQRVRCRCRRRASIAASSGIAAVSPLSWAAFLCLWRYREPRLTVRANGVEHQAAAASPRPARFMRGDS